MTTEMPWSEAQQKRLLQEKTTIDKFFRDTKWQGQNRRDTTWVISPVTTSSQKKYYLGCRLPQDYPNSPPVLYVMHPNPLPGVTELSHEHHTRNKHPEFGYTHVCHYRKWGPEKSIYLVLMKGRLWLEAYDAYMAGKGKIDEFLKTDNEV